MVFMCIWATYRRVFIIIVSQLCMFESLLDFFLFVVPLSFPSIVRFTFSGVFEFAFRHHISNARFPITSLNPLQQNVVALVNRQDLGSIIQSKQRFAKKDRFRVTDFSCFEFSKVLADRQSC